MIRFEPYPKLLASNRANPSRVYLLPETQDSRFAEGRVTQFEVLPAPLAVTLSDCVLVAPVPDLSRVEMSQV